MPALLELQRRFAAGLGATPQAVEDWAASDGIPAAARLRVYRSNSRALFEQALQLTYPVLQRRVGHDYFRQLSHHFRQAHPSCAGDLHEVGRRFASFLGKHLAETPYAWLAELALLEWAVAEAGVAADSPCASATSLAAVSPDAIAAARFQLVPSLQQVAGSVPVLSVWRANQSEIPAGAVDLSAGPEYVVVHRDGPGTRLRSVSRCEYAFVGALAAGATLGTAVEHAELPLQGLASVLHRLFVDGVVAAVLQPSAA